MAASISVASSSAILHSLNSSSTRVGLSSSSSQLQFPRLLPIGTRRLSSSSRPRFLPLVTIFLLSVINHYLLESFICISNTALYQTLGFMSSFPSFLNHITSARVYFMDYAFVLLFPLIYVVSN